MWGFHSRIANGEIWGMLKSHSNRYAEGTLEHVCYHMMLKLSAILNIDQYELIIRYSYIWIDERSHYEVHIQFSIRSLQKEIFCVKRNGKSEQVSFSKQTFILKYKLQFNNLLPQIQQCQQYSNIWFLLKKKILSDCNILKIAT